MSIQNVSATLSMLQRKNVAAVRTPAGGRVMWGMLFCKVVDYSISEVSW